LYRFMTATLPEIGRADTTSSCRGWPVPDPDRPVPAVTFKFLALAGKFLTLAGKFPPWPASS
jgi:hypothetical protein